MNKIKVAHILHSVGGVDVSLRLILENINPESFDNIVIHGKEDTKLGFVNKENQKIIEYKLPIQREISFLKDIVSINKTIKILKKERPDIIHAHSAKGGVIGKIVGKVLKTPVLHTPQAYSFMSATGYKKRLFILIEKMFVSFKNNKILASSNSEKDRALNTLRYPKNRVLLFNNSISEIDSISPLSINKSWPDDYICSVGRPSYQKNIELMLDVLFEIKKTKKDIHLVLMGVGYHSPNLDVIKNKIKKLNLENNISLLEWTTREDIFNIIKNSKLYLTTARYEGLPYSVIESLALGKPIVGTNSDGNRDLIVHGQNGYLVDNENEKELADAVLKIISDKNLHKEFTKSSLTMFLENFNISSNIKNLEKIYLKNIKA